MKFLLSLVLSSIFIVLPFIAMATGGATLAPSSGVTPTSAVAETPFCALYASPSSIQKGSSSILSWKITNAPNFSIDNGVGKQTTSGSKTVSPTNTITYTGTINGVEGTVGTCTVTLTVTATSPTASTKSSKTQVKTPVPQNSICKSGKGGLCNPLKAQSITAFLNDILDFAVKIGTIFIVLMLVFVGFKFTAARGNAGELEKVRTMFLWTIIGAVVILGAHVISNMIASTITIISQAP